MNRTTSDPPEIRDAQDHRAQISSARRTPGDRHVQWTDDDEVSRWRSFSDPRAHERAIMFAERCYGGYEEVRAGESVSLGHGSAR
jgi:hypothetical protein